MSANVAQLHADLSVLLNAVAKSFRPGVRVTLVCRFPDNIEQTVCLTSEPDDDELDRAFDFARHVRATGRDSA